MGYLIPKPCLLKESDSIIWPIARDGDKRVQTYSKGISL